MTSGLAVASEVTEAHGLPTAVCILFQHQFFKRYLLVKMVDDGKL
jgi:hypothetical protein